jgi:hypothetical protein
MSGPVDTSTASVERWAREFDVLADDQSRMSHAHYYDVAAFLRALALERDALKLAATREWTGSVFIGSPPEPFADWDAWQKAGAYAGVEVIASPPSRW